MKNLQINLGTGVYLGILGLAAYGVYKLFKADEKERKEFKEYREKRLEEEDLGINEASIENEDLEPEDRTYAKIYLTKLNTRIYTAKNKDDLDKAIKKFIETRDYLTSTKPVWAKASYISAIRTGEQELERKAAEREERRRERENRDAFVNALRALKSEVNVIVGDENKRKEVANDIFTKVITG